MPETCAPPTAGPRRDAPGVRRPACVAAVGSALPATEVRNAEIAQRLGVDEEWIVKRTGIHARRRAVPGERLEGLAAQAAESALRRAGIPADDLDLVLVASFTQDELLPNAAPLVAGAIGAQRAGALDLGAACTGFLSGLAMAAGQVESGRADAVLVVGADLLSRVTDQTDRRTAALFGDGAGAAVVTAAHDAGPGIGPLILRADASGASCITASHTERLIRMRGQDTFKAAVARMSEATLEVLELAELGLDDIDHFVYHQANGRILAAVAEQLALPRERVADCIGVHGNTSAASIPIALDCAVSDGRLRDGDRVLVAAFGAGLTWGAGVLRWGDPR